MKVQNYYFNLSSKASQNIFHNTAQSNSLLPWIFLLYYLIIFLRLFLDLNTFISVLQIFVCSVTGISTKGCIPDIELDITVEFIFTFDTSHQLLDNDQIDNKI